MLRSLPRFTKNSFVIKRYSSSLLAKNEEAEFANRKQIISESPNSYYKTLNEIRFKDANRLRIPEFRQKFVDFQWPENKRIDEEYTIEGKIQSIRRSGKGMVFIDIIQDFQKIQLVLMNKMIGLTKEEFSEHHDHFQKGDFIIAKGFPGITNVGELSLKCSNSIILASPTLHPLPPKLSNPEKRHSNKIVDYLVNKDSQNSIIIRSIIINTLRNFLNNKGFLEVNTPIISNSSKGANATPFITSSQHIKDSKGNPLDLQLRVAPELWLKKLIIGGFDKVYEIGQVFRNEGIDSTHNPEFTTCEFYQSFTNLEELMNMTELIFHDISKAVSKFEQSQDAIKLINQDGSHFQKLEFIPTIESQTGIKFPQEINPDSLLEYFQKINIEPPQIKSSPQLLDKLASIYIEPLCTKPTFIYHHPAIMSPLAKSTIISYSSDQNYEISRRFELFIKGKEFVNAYEEENSPFEQELKFKLQQSMKDEFNDDESIVPDSKYVKSMEWSMPPTGGWGIGIDRLSMFFSGKDRIEEVLTFGTLNDVLKQ
ncbi:Lysyl-tRNA synthetase [Wickerhamomyces ciferrii]|uniref:Lysine--tRNA ligase n=1 Tax=Wickerhamomyces ciferrii (strain ATCC 14091 / BCRC 22168 / CBS 111 / JCM 3599 / NBRC 0793 / NRRL Y-1031 F-60-10) TaxID=1206466 RepID=K0KBR2_WICCF|nr:Lysyl-tRNA synthetase [Wickerhamomyces ciferrii]CCH42500.1 Lysyl-tRNA synthetase [Wickerhamomyces ciferrii]